MLADAPAVTPRHLEPQWRNCVFTHALRRLAADFRVRRRRAPGDTFFDAKTPLQRFPPSPSRWQHFFYLHGTGGQAARSLWIVC